MSHPIIIIEGCDGTGKTTLARKLVELYRGYYIHNRRHRDVWPYHAASLRQAVRLSQMAPVIIDRHWPSECVYGKIYRGGVQSRYNERALHRVLARYGATYVLAAPAPEVAVNIHSRMKQTRGELFKDVSEVAAMYRLLWDGTGGSGNTGGGVPTSYLEQLMTRGVKDRLNWLLYDLTEWSGDVGVVRFAERVMDEARLNRLTAWLPGKDHGLWNLAGTVKPGNVLLVGDRLGDSESCTPWPFFAPNGSSAYLSKVMAELRLDEDSFALVNANDPDHEHLAAAAEICGTVVALGREAEEGLRELGIKYNHAVRHPQHARRFTHHKRSYYDELEQALDPTADKRL